ncbi:MAG: hypothetical protein ACRCSK_04050 [Fusobacteriaceae bacterium]
MKKIMKFFAFLSFGIFVGCSSLNVKEVYTKEQAANWEKTIPEEMKKYAQIPEWYGDDNPLLYLRDQGKLNQADYFFFEELAKFKSKPDELPNEATERFSKILNGYINGMPRKFFLKDENIKDGRGLVRKMVSDSFQRMTNPSVWISKEVATDKEWAEIVALSKKDDITEDDITDIRKLLNTFIKRDEFFDVKSWYIIEISPRMNTIVKIHEQQKKSSMEKNNVNAKALYIAYGAYLSPMGRWDN